METAQTDSTEQGRFMWARVKGKTENDLLRIGFAQASISGERHQLPGFCQGDQVPKLAMAYM